MLPSGKEKSSKEDTVLKKKSDRIKSNQTASTFFECLFKGQQQ